MDAAGGAAGPSASAVERLYAFALVCVWSVGGFRFEDATRWQVARSRVRATWGDHPDIELRHDVVRVGASFATVGGFAIFLLGALLNWLSGSEVWIDLAFRLGSLWFAAAGVCIVRLAFGNRDRQRWLAAGAPERWRASRPSVPGNRDVLYWAVLGSLMVWAVPYVELASR